MNHTMLFKLRQKSYATGMTIYMLTVVKSLTNGRILENPVCVEERIEKRMSN